MRKFAIAFIVTCAISWLAIFLFAHYRTNVMMARYAPSKVVLADKRIYVKFGIKHPLTIVLKGSITKADDYLCDVNLHLYPSFASMVGDMYVSNHMISIPVSVTTKLSKSNNFYIAEFSINHATFKVNDADISVDGGIALYQDRLPSGGYRVSISDKEKLLASDLLAQHPDILRKTKRILSKIGTNYQDIRIEYTESGLQVDGIPIEAL